MHCREQVPEVVEPEEDVEDELDVDVEVLPEDVEEEVLLDEVLLEEEEVEEVEEDDVEVQPGTLVS